MRPIHNRPPIRARMRAAVLVGGVVGLVVAVGGCTVEGAAEPDPHRGVEHMVLRFSSAKTASLIAKRILDLVPYPTIRATRGRIAGSPSTDVIRKVVDMDFEQNITQAVTARGPYLIYTAAMAPTSEGDWPDRTVKKAVELQGPLIDGFPVSTRPTPTGSERVRLDQNKILIYALPTADEKLMAGIKGAVYGPRAAANVGFDRGLLEEAGVENLAFDESVVYRAADDEKAQRLEAGLLRQAKAGGYQPSVSPPGLPIAPCVKKQDVDGERLSCYVRVGRYVGEVNNAASFDDPNVVLQQITAQYLILTKADQEAN